MVLPRLAVLLFGLSNGASAAGIQVDVIPNFIGAGLGVTTEWLGSKDKVGGLVPGGRVALEKNRFLEIYGPIADMNVLDHPNWEFGPMVSYPTQAFGFRSAVRCSSASAAG